MKRLLASLFVLTLSLSMVRADISLPKEDNPITKLGRGIANTGAGFIHILDSPLSLIDTEGGTVAFTRGGVQGVWRAVADTAHGCFDIITFPLPIGPGFTYQTWKQPPYDSMVVSEYPPADLNAYYVY